MPTTIVFPLSARMLSRVDGRRRDRSGAIGDLVMVTLWAVTMLLIGAAVHFGAPSAEDSAIQLIGVL